MKNCKSLVSFLLLGSLCCLLGGVSAQADSTVSIDRVLIDLINNISPLIIHYLSKIFIPN